MTSLGFTTPSNVGGGGDVHMPPSRSATSWPFAFHSRWPPPQFHQKRLRCRGLLTFSLMGGLNREWGTRVYPNSMLRNMRRNATREVHGAEKRNHEANIL